MQKHHVDSEKCDETVFLTKVHKEDFPFESQRHQVDLFITFCLDTLKLILLVKVSEVLQILIVRVDSTDDEEDQHVQDSEEGDTILKHYLNQRDLLRPCEAIVNNRVKAHMSALTVDDALWPIIVGST